MKRISKIQIICVAILIFTLHPLNMAAEEKDSTSVISPRKTFFISLAFPGAGQLYLNRPLKAVGFISAEVFYIYKTVEYNKIYQYVKNTKADIGIDIWNSLTEAQKKDSVNLYTGYKLTVDSWRVREKRNKYAWWCAGVYFISILDAYVDAHLSNFPKDDIDVSAIADRESVGMNISFALERKK
ncbi:MAG: hypothetical protein COT43_07605 [Candidatus Marinimicrobia bacterium CG08_land_8_20_14_0_20_45_22]|nr:MAG: hypothetical protein COT43_07605 [Candidatus Marinimicrobia bacterium CG08_land_8_20_14_0_20_45_22]